MGILSQKQTVVKNNICNFDLYGSVCQAKPPKLLVVADRSRSARSSKVEKCINHERL